MTDSTALSPVPGFVDLHDRLRAGETLYGTFAGLGSPVATELVARAGFDWLIIDLEHGVGTESELLANLHAVGATRAAAGVAPIAWRWASRSASVPAPCSRSMISQSKPERAMISVATGDPRPANAP